jgi:hypothetical protein
VLLFDPKGNILAYVLYAIVGEVYLSAEPGVQAMLYSMGLAVVWRLLSRIAFHFTNMLAAVYVFIVERKRIIPIPWYKKLLFCITWPTFDIIHRYCLYIAMFKKVTWKPIPHTSKVTIEDIEK